MDDEDEGFDFGALTFDLDEYDIEDEAIMCRKQY